MRRPSFLFFDADLFKKSIGPFRISIQYTSAYRFVNKNRQFYSKQLSSPGNLTSGSGNKGEEGMPSKAE